MNMRDRMLAVIRGGSLDRVPFVQYDGLGDRNEDIWHALGRDNMGILRWCGVHRLEHPHCRIETEEMALDGRRGWRDALITPVGTLTQERLLVPDMGGATAFAKHYVQSPDDYRVLNAYLRDITVVEDLSSAQKAIAELGEDGLPHVNLGRTPFQALWIEWVSIMDLSLHLADEPDLVAECMELLGRITRRISEVACCAAGRIDIPYVVVADNITAPAIGEPRFRRYCLPYYKEIAGMMAEKDLPLFVHMDGDLKPLSGAIGESGVKGLDSFSPAPDNDTSVAEAVAMWPEMRLLVNFPSSVHLCEPATIYRVAQEILEAGGRNGRLQIQVSENMPPGAWKRSFPEIIRAIQDFGRP